MHHPVNSRDVLRYLFPLCLLATTACQPSPPAGLAQDVAPGATGDPRALALAASVIEAAGGRAAWDSVRYVSFTFFGNRRWHWDKHEQRYRVESDKRGYRITGRTDGTETRLWLRDRPETHPDTLARYGQHAYEAWINDTYWFIMPFKLLDPGVGLQYAGPCLADSQTAAVCLELTFQEVGVTPDNKYRIYIDTVQDRVVRWDYFRSRRDSLPALSAPWTDYQRLGNVWLSGGRGDRHLTDIALPEDLPDALFEDVTRPAADILATR